MYHNGKLFKSELAIPMSGVERVDKGRSRKFQGIRADQIECIKN